MIDELISIVMTVYNGAPYLKRTISSVVEQSYPHFEFIIVDDGSTDETAEILNEYASMENVKIIFNSHSGNVGKNLNDCIKRSNGRVIAILGADDIWYKEKLQIQISYLNKYKIVCTNGNVIDANDKITFQKVNDLGRGVETLSLNRLLEDNRIIASSVLSYKDVLIESGLFDETVGNRSEDYILWLKIARNYEIGYLDQVLVGYRIHGDNLTVRSFKDKKELFLRNVQIISEYMNDGDKSIVRSANIGICANYIKLVKLFYMNDELSNSLFYCRKFLSNYYSKFSFKYIKGLIFYLYLLFLYYLRHHRNSSE